MVEKVITSPRNVVDFARYQQSRMAPVLSARACRHCGAVLLEDEREEECSSAFNLDAPALRAASRKFYAD